MSARRAMTPVCVGLRAIRGGAVTVGVALIGDEPRVVLSSFLPTSAEGDRVSFEPYHVAAELKRGRDGGVSSEAAAIVAKGCKRQRELATKGLEDIVGKLHDERYAPALTALLINRAGWVTDLLAYSLGSPDHPPVAEGLAVREALRFACQKTGITIAEVDEKSLPDLASQALRLGSTGVDARLKTLGATAGKPWRKEQKLACLAAWLTLAASP